MAYEPCPVCGSTVNAKYTVGSGWCIVCAEQTLDEQAIERDAPVQREIIDT